MHISRVWRQFSAGMSGTIVLHSLNGCPDACLLLLRQLRSCTMCGKQHGPLSLGGCVPPAEALGTIFFIASVTQDQQGSYGGTVGGAQVFDAYVVGSPGAPGIVVLQEWWGVDFEIKNHAAAIAKKGYRALIPDLDRGKLGLDDAEAHYLMEGLDWQGAVKDIVASVKWLKENGSPKAILQAAKGLEEKLKAAGLHGQGHAFMNSSEEAIKRKKAVGFSDHDQGAVNLAWSRFDAWFDKYLKA